jgi:hypothetical protein
LKGCWPRSDPVFKTFFYFSLHSLTPRNTSKLQHKIEPLDQVPPGTAIHRKKDPSDPAKPLASPVFLNGGRGKRRFLKGRAGRLRKRKKRKGKQRSYNRTLAACHRARRLNPENYLGIFQIQI